MKTNETLVSVIIPIYNVEQYLDKCIESVIGQTYKNLEIILVDDGSPDNCPRICDEWAKKDKRIKVIHKQNGGLSDARNAGIDIATGEYIAFLDSDDFLDESFVEETLNCALKNKADLVCARFKKFYEGQSIEKEKSSGDIKVFKDKTEIMSLLYDEFFFAVIACAKLYKKEIFKDLRFEKGKINEDVFICHYVMDKVGVYAYITKPLYFYLQRDGSIMNKKFSIKRLDGFEAIQDRYNFIEKNYPQLLEKERVVFLACARYFYFQSRKSKLGKDVLKQIREKFNKVYAQCDHKKIFDIMFKLTPTLYCFVYSIKEKLKKD